MSYIDSYRFVPEVVPIPIEIYNYRGDELITLPNIPTGIPIFTDMGTESVQGNVLEQAFILENTGVASVEIADIVFSSPQLSYTSEVFNSIPGTVILGGTQANEITIHATHDGDIGIMAESMTVTFVEGAATPNPLVLNLTYEFTE